jgi:photosystem II stability/assembly factor-like uncharacterized protein
MIGDFAWGEGIWHAPWLPMMRNGRALCFRAAHFVSPQRGWAVGDSVLSDVGFIAYTSGNGWQAQFQVSHFHPRDIQFLTNMKGWVAGWREIGDKQTEGVLLSSEDGGKHWNERHRLPWNVGQIQFVNERNGWIIGGALDADGISKSVILVTIDGGENWTPQYKGVNEVLNIDLCFTDASNGWAVGWAKEQNLWRGVLLRTTDGGRNWTHLPVGHLQAEQGIAAIDFISASEGWSVVTKGDFIRSEGVTDRYVMNWTIFHTQDGGITWEKQKTGTEEKRSWMPNPTICFVTEKEGWMTAGGTIFHTEDGGLKWNVQEYQLIRGDVEIDLWALGMYFLDDRRGWIVGDGILTTTDAGVTWLQEPQRPFGNVGLNKICFTTSKKGWVVGENGSIFHTDDGGLTWDIQNSSTDTELRGIHFITSERGWVVGDKGTILHTINGGLTWTKQKSGTNISLNDVQFINAQEGWIVGGQTTPAVLGGGIILHTKDGGRKWKTDRNLPDNISWLHDIHFVNERTGWATGLGVIIHTQDGGKSWRRQRCANLDSRHFAVHFLDTLTGWMITNEEIAHTVDGGRTWEAKYHRDPEESLRTIYFANRHEGWAFGRRGDGILHTTNGGQTWETQQAPPGYAYMWLRSACYGGRNTLWAVGENGSLLKYSDPNLRLIQPSYWAVEASDRQPTSWGAVKEYLIPVKPLLPNYPNPFNAETWIPYHLSKDVPVTIQIYDASGKLVRQLELGRKPAGKYLTKENAAYWDGRNEFGAAVASGLYFYRLKAGKFTATRRMLVVK